MDAKDVFLNIAQNQANFSKVSQDTAANAINNEETFERPATYFMYSPEKDDIDKNGSLKVQGYRKMLESGSFDGAGATLANARLYSFFEPIQNELFEKEQEYKKFVFDNSSAFSQFGSDLMRNWYSLKKNEAIYKMAKAQQDGDLNSVLDYKYQIENLDKQISKYVTPEDGFVNTTANVLTSMARNAPELLAVSAGAAAVTYLTGGLGLPAYLTAAGATMANGAIIYNDTYKLEAGEILQELERTSPNMSLDERLAVAERYANLSALIEASGALFGLVGMGTRGITRLAAQFSKQAAGKLSTRTATKFIANVAKRKALRELIKLPLNEKLKNPKYIAYIGRKVGEHFFGAGGEALQEVTQATLQDAFVNAIMSGEDPNNIDLIDNIFEALKDGSNQSKYAQLFLNTFLASLFISGTTATAVTGAKTGVQKLMARSMQNMNADQVSQNIIDQKKKSVAYSKSPKAYGENTQEIINAGNAPETVAMDANNLLGVLDDAEKKGETTILQKLNELGITRDKLEKSIAGSGVFKIDFAQFDNVVLDPNDEGLFQKVKGQYTFDETTLTKKELEVLMNDLATKRPELKEAVQNKDSAFNITLNALMQNKNFTHKQAVINAMGAQLMVNRAATFKSENGEPVSFDVLNRTQKELGLTGADLLQTAYAGSRVDYDTPSLEAIGSGEGAQAHGWGLYYALNKDIAEDYRTRFTVGEKLNELVSKYMGLYRGDILSVARYGKNYVIDFYNDLIEQNEVAIKSGNAKKENIEKMRFQNETYRENIEKIKTINEKDFEDFGRGQVHEVDLPEAEFLLDEQKKFSEQSQFVQEKLKELAKENTGLREAINSDIAIGRDFYVRLGADLASGIEDVGKAIDEAPKLASKKLESVGIKGITYEGQQDGRAFVIFNPDSVKVLQKFYQTTQQKYTADTINIDGVEKTVYNSNGERIATTEQGLRNFYKWFGDSKVVDEQGRPLVVYHGTSAEFTKFDKRRQRKHEGRTGFWFSNVENDFGASVVGGTKKVMPVYLSLKNPYIVNANGNDWFDIEVGKDIYPDIHEAAFGYKFQGHSATADMLSAYAKKAGYDGLIINNVIEGDFKGSVERQNVNDYVVFEPNQIKSTGNVGTFSTDENNIFKQTIDSQQIAGMFSREYGKNIIKLTEAANPTTFMHEFMHMTMVEMLDAYNSGQMTDYWKKQTDAIAAFGGFEKDKNGLYITASSDPVANAKVIAAHERVADAFTTYLKEGKAPVESLSDMFHQFMEWFVDVYKRLVMNDVKLNKSIRKAFDSLLVSKEEMDQAIIDKNLRAIGRRPGVSEDEYQSYLSDLSTLNRVSTNKHLEAIRRKQRIATEQKNKQKLDEIRKEVDAQVSQDPRYQFVDDVIARKLNASDIPQNLKVKNPMLFLRQDGIPAQQFITDHSDVVSNVADIVELLNNLESKSQLVERTAQEQFSEWLNKEYPELADIDAKAAATNDQLIKVRLKEYMMLMHIPMSQFKQYYNELIKAGDSEVESMKLRELMNVERLLDLETRIVTKARVAKTDTELANALWHQAAVDYIIMRAKDIKVQVNRFTRHFDKYKYLPSQAELKRIDAYDFDMITGILRNLGFTRKQPRVRDIPLGVRINEWVDDKMNSSFSSADEVRDYIPTLTMPTVDKFDNNTYHDFGTFDVLTRLIEGISRSDKELTEIDKTKLRQEDADAIIEYQAKKGINPSTLSWWTDMMVMKEQYLKKILPVRQFLDYVSPFVQAHALREQRIAKNDEAAYGVLKDMIDSEKQLFTVPLASGGVLNMTYADMQIAVLNIDNMEKWIMSWNFQRQANLTEDDFLSIIEAAPQKMLDNAQTIWNVFDSQKKEFREAQYKINGFLMDYVEPRAITLSDGRTIQSGYYPSGKIPTSQKEFGNMIMSFGTNGVYNMATSKFAKDRKEGVVYDSLDLTINSLRSWLYHTATVIEIGPHFNKLSKLINETSLTNQLGPDVVKSLNDWMSYSIVGDNLNKFYASLDKISSVQILGWEPFRAVVQAFGWIPSMSTIGPQWIVPQFLRATSYTNIFSIKEAAKLSPYMRMRYENAINHIASVSESNQLIRTGKTLADKMMNVAMWFTAHGDAFSSYIVWNAAFEKATAEGYSRQEAYDIADSAVRTSQGDSTGVSRPKILQGDKRVITKFASYFIAMNSRVSSAFIGKERVELVAMMMLAGIVAPIVEAYLRSGYEWFVGSDDDKKKWRKLRLHSFEDVMFYNMKQNVLSTIGQTALPIMGIGGYIGNLLATGNTYDKPIPMIDYALSIGKTAAYPALALTAETEREKKRYIGNFEKSLLKSLTVPNKFIRMIVD